MAGCGWKRFTVITVGSFIITALLVSADEDVKTEASSAGMKSLYDNALNFLWQKGRLGYTQVWPEMEFGWKIVAGSIIGFIGAAFGSVGGVGGGGFFVPMLSLIIGFDAKSAAAMSKFMIVGAAGSTVYYNIKLRHPTLDMPLIDYDLALLFQPMLVLGISIGVLFNVIFAEWMITVLLIILFAGASTKAFLRGVETWKMETIMKDNEAAALLQSHGSNGTEDVEYTVLPDSAAEETKRTKVPFRENVAWKELGMLVAVWFAILGLELGKNYSTTCSAAYWVLNVLQIPVAVGVSGYEAFSLYKGKRVISSTGTGRSSWKVHQLILYCLLGVLAGVAGGLLGLGGGFILGPLFLELGIPPQVASATATFAMTFSSSMSVVEFYLLKRFPVPYALYFVGVSTVAGIIGHYTLRRLITFLGRASLIIFVLASMIFISAISLGGVGIANIIKDIEDHANMGFDNICTYTS